MITTKPSYPTTYDRAIDIAMRSGFGQNVNLPPQGYRATVDQALRFGGTQGNGRAWLVVGLAVAAYLMFIQKDKKK